MTALKLHRIRLASLCFALLLGATVACPATDSFVWRKDQNRVDANIHDWPLPTVLKSISAKSGWEVYVEPEADYKTSAKFKNLPPAEALRFLLGDLNFAIVPQSNSLTRLYVFKTSMQKATRLVESPASKVAAGSITNRIPNELIVRLKPGAKIEDIARLLGAKVTGRIDSLNAYRLQFDDSAAADDARDALASNPDVTSVDYNYSIDRPVDARQMASSSVPPLNLKLNPPSGNGRIIVGLVDTPIQSLGDNLDAFVLKPVAVAGDANPSPNQPTHATSMAGTMLTSLQTATGGSTSVQILPVDVYGNNAQTTTFDVALGIAKAVNAGANPINLSLGSPVDSSFLHDVITEASQKGIVLFAAAGNEHVTSPVYPAAYKEVTSVTAVDRNNNIAGFANYSSSVDIGAPGASVFYFNGKPYYTAGTSVSSAYATGLAAGIADATKKTIGTAQTLLLKDLAVKLPSP